MSDCPACLNGCGGVRSDCPMRDFMPADKGGRPTTYTDDKGAALLARIAAGESLRSICADPAMPPRSTVKGWIIRDVEGFASQYARARELGLEEMADEILEIADDGSRDYKQTADGKEVPDYDHIQRSKLRVDTRKWILSKQLSKQYGDKIIQEHTGLDGGPIKTDGRMSVTDLSKLPLEELSKLQKEEAGGG